MACWITARPIEVTKQSTAKHWGHWLCLTILGRYKINQVLISKPQHEDILLLQAHRRMAIMISSSVTGHRPDCLVAFYGDKQSCDHSMMVLNAHEVAWWSCEHNGMEVLEDGRRGESERWQRLDYWKYNCCVYVHFLSETNPLSKIIPSSFWTGKNKGHI